MLLDEKIEFRREKESVRKILHNREGKEMLMMESVVKSNSQQAK